MFFTPRAGSLDEVWMLLHQILPVDTEDEDEEEVWAEAKDK
jgi:hypothetical protein